MSRVIRVRYENGVFKPLEPVELPEGKELIVKIIDVEDRIEKLRRYRGILGRASEKEIEELLLEAEFERL